PPFFSPFRRRVSDPLHTAVAFATRFDPRGGALMVAPPTLPKPDTLPSVEVYRSAIAEGKDHPGARSFRANTDLYCELNKTEVEDKARKEGVTTREIKELTFFGFAAMRATQPEKVSQV